MGKVGFVLLVVGGVLVLMMGVNIAIDVQTRATIAFFFNTYVGEPIGIPTLGDTVANLLYLLTLLGAVCIIVGAVIWFAAGTSCFRLIGKTLTSIGTFTITYQVIWSIYLAWQAHVFDKPLLDILTYFTSLNLGFAALVLTWIGTILGASRRPKPKPAPLPPSQPSPQPA